MSKPMHMPAMPMSGAPNKSEKATPEIQGFVDKLLKEVNTKTGKKYTKLTAMEFRSQVVAGLNYFIKVKANDGAFLHLRVHKPLPHAGNEPLLHGVQENVTEKAAIENF